jgi:hypothetical protein
MVGIPYDDLAHWRGPYPADVFAAQFEKLSKGWDAGLAELERAAAAAPDRPAVAEDLLLARAAGLHFRSVANQVRFIQARDTGRPTEQWVREEMRAAKELFAVARRDARVGFEASNHYYYVPQDLVEKVINCQHLLEGTAR